MNEMLAAAPRVLLVEDDEDMRVLLADTFGNRGWRVDVACDGEEALRRLDERGYDLVVTDFWLREFNGAEIVAYMHAIGNAPPVVMMSAAPQGLALPGACVADAYLRKPFSLEQIVATASRLMETRPRRRRDSSGSGTFRFEHVAEAAAKSSK